MKPKSNKTKAKEARNEWKKLNGVQKSQELLSSSRLNDHLEFIENFKSWEFPIDFEINSL